MFHSYILDIWYVQFYNLCSVNMCAACFHSDQKLIKKKTGGIKTECAMEQTDRQNHGHCDY